MHMMDCSCAPILRFLYSATDGATAERQIQKRIFGQFCASFTKDSVANYECICTVFTPTVRRPGVLYNVLFDVSLPSSVRNVPSLMTFRRDLKTTFSVVVRSSLGDRICTIYCNYCLPAATGYQPFCLFFFASQ